MLHHSAVCATLLLTDHDLTDHGDNAELYARCSGASVQTGRTAKMGIDAQHCTGRLGLYQSRLSTDECDKKINSGKLS